MTRRLRFHVPLALTLAGAGLALAGCAPTVALDPAPDATNPECAEMIVRLPRAVADQDIRETNAQATAAWGDPASVLLRCGITIPGPTSLPCYNINGVDWIEDESDKPSFRFVTYGRDPATEVIIDSTSVSGGTALIDLADVISVVPQTKKCTSVQDLTIPTQ